MGVQTVKRVWTFAIRRLLHDILDEHQEQSGAKNQMRQIVDVRKTYKYRLYASKRDFRLHDQFNIAGIVWNHLTALQKRYYRLFGKHISESRIKQHIAKLRMKTAKFRYWRKLGSQSVQEICERHEKAYQRFFKKQGGLPRFKKVKKFRSFVLKQAGWKLEAAADKPDRKIRIGDTTYKLVYHRPMAGDIKTITVSRDAAGRLWLCFSVVEKMALEDEISMGKIGGFDFGLKTFLTTDEGRSIQSPLFFTQDLPRLRSIQRQVSKKVSGSNNQRAGKWHIARSHVRIADQRRDFHFQLAHELCDHYEVLVFEELNIAAMKRLWGRKVSDLGFAQFVKIVQWVAFKRGVQVVLIDRWERTTGKCSGCKHEQGLALSERTFCCGNCGLTLDRDQNAARNIVALGHQRMLSSERVQASEEVQAHSAASGEEAAALAFRLCR